MHGRLFTLITADYSAIYAWGMEITHEAGCTAVIYRWDPTTREPMFGTHPSAEEARELYSRLLHTPLIRLWMDYSDEIDDLHELLEAAYPEPA